MKLIPKRIYDEIPPTTQGLITYTAYAKKQIKKLKKDLKDLQLIVSICEERLENYERGDNIAMDTVS